MVPIFSFFENMERIMHPSFVPTFNDVLRSRVRTTGIIETHIQVEDVSYRFVKHKEIFPNPALPPTHSSLSQDI